MSKDLLIDFGLSVLFSVLRERGADDRLRKAFRKLYKLIGTTYGWPTQEDCADQLTLTLSE